jgi:hypothetical protein
MAGNTFGGSARVLIVLMTHGTIRSFMYSIKGKTKMKVTDPLPIDHIMTDFAIC